MITETIQPRPEDAVTQRLFVPPDCTGLSEPHIQIGPDYTARYSSMVETSFTQHIEALSPLDNAIPFEKRIENPDLAHAYYRNLVEAPRADYWRDIDVWARLAGEITPGKRLSAVGRVALEQETIHIRHSLEQYATQTLSSTDYELLLLLNARGIDDTAKQRTLREIEDFRQDYRDIDIRTVEVSLTNEKLSDIKKMACDVMMVRTVMSPGIDQEQYVMLLNDADTAFMHPDYLEDYVSLFSADSNADLAVHRQDLDHRAFKLVGPDFTFGVRVRQAIERQLARNSGLIFPGGCDMAMRPHTYPSLGGFVPNKPFGVDYTFGKLLHHYRQGNHTARVVRPDEIGIQTSARRPVYSHVQGLRSGLNTLPDEYANHELRTAVYPRISNEAPPLDLLQAEALRIEDYISTLAVPPDHSAIPHIFRHFGVEMTRRADAYHITDADIFLAAYERAFGEQR